MYINSCERTVVFRGTNGIEFLSVSKQRSTETTLYNGTEYPLIRLDCTVGQWHLDSSGTNSKYNEDYYPSSKRAVKLRNRDRKRLCNETPIAEFNG